MKKASIFLMALICLIISCTKNKENQDPSPIANPYYQAVKGNYWIYDVYKIDTANGGSETLVGTDSVVVSGDTLIDDKRYAVFSGTDLPFSSQWRALRILRDSSGCLVDNNGVVKFSSANNVGDTLSTSYIITGSSSAPDTFIVFKWFMAAPPTLINVPAGSFTVLNGMQKLTEPHSGVTISFPHCYARNVGLVMSQNTWEYQIRLGIYYEKRLVRYHISS